MLSPIVSGLPPQLNEVKSPLDRNTLPHRDANHKDTVLVINIK